jgi:nitrite reductase/ring-hydroxylating ferredoxin subunit
MSEQGTDDKRYTNVSASKKELDVDASEAAGLLSCRAGDDTMDYVRVGHVRDLDRVRMKSYRMLGRVIGIFREPDGSFWATEIGCKHQNADLVNEGRWNGDVVTCSRHGWKYDVRTGQCLNQKSALLRRHHLKVVAGELHVSIRPIEEVAKDDDEPMPEIVMRPKGEP